MNRHTTAFLCGAAAAGLSLLAAALASSVGSLDHGSVAPGQFEDAWRMYWAGAGLLTALAAVAGWNQ